jgi:lipopolysaccharide export system permease protein
MKIISRYVAREFLKIFSLSLVALICVFTIVDLFDLVDDIVKNHCLDGSATIQDGSGKSPCSLQTVVTYFLTKIPWLIFMITPISILLSTLLTLGTFSRNSEIIAMLANGISIYRLLIPLLILGFIASILLFIANETFIPWGNQISDMCRKIIKGRVLDSQMTKSSVWFRSPRENRIYNIKLLDPRRSELHGVTIYALDENFNIKERIDARVAQYVNGQWILHNGSQRTFTEDVLGRSQIGFVERKGFPIQPSFEEFQRIRKDPEEMTYRELERYIAELQSTGYDTSRYIVDLRGKVSFPFVSVVMVIIGFPFALRSPRSGASVSVGLSIFIGFSYWIILNLGLSLGHAQIFPPTLAAWVSHILFAAAGGYLILSTQT